MSKIRILVIDDQYGRWDAHRQAFLDAVTDPAVALSRLWEFTFCSGQVHGRNSLAAIDEIVREGWFGATATDVWSLVLLDIRFDEEAGGQGSEFGFEVLEHLREQFGRTLPIVMLTREDRDDARRLSGRGLADGFLHKQNLSAEVLAERILEHGLFPDIRRKLFPEAQSSGELIGSSLPFLLTLREARRVASRPNDGCLILGETGSGKTELAGLIHDHSERRRRRFKKWTAEGLREDLMKDALFGHWKGAHSVATTSEAGEIEKCDGGTFFLDEIASLAPGVQELFLELRRRDQGGQRAITRLGTFPSAAQDVRQAKESVIGDLLATHSIKVDVALIAATNQNITDEDGSSPASFRKDLLNAFGKPLIFPPLAARRGDIPLLFESFVRRIRGTRHYSIDPDVISQLQSYDWTHKNIVVLKRIAERAAHEARDFDEILPHHVAELFEARSSDATVPPKRDAGVNAEPLGERVGLSSESGYLELKGALSAAQTSHLQRVLQMFGAALRATRKKDDKTTTLDALCMLLGVPRLAASPRAQSKKSYDIIRNILGMAEINCAHRSVVDCLIITDETISVGGDSGSMTVLSRDPVVIKHVKQALESRGPKGAAS